MSSSNSPCAACKFLRRKCTQECVFAPYFPPDQPEKFSDVHKVFGASNVAKILSDLNVAQRADAVSSLAYEARARIDNPIYGCVGAIYFLQQRLKAVHSDLYSAKRELSDYIGPSAMLPILQQPGGFIPQQQINNPYNVLPHHQQQQQQQMIMDARAQQMVAAREQQEMWRAAAYEQHQQQQQQEMVRFSGGFEVEGVLGGECGFGAMTIMSPPPPGCFENNNNNNNNHYQIQQQTPPPPQEEEHTHHHQLQLFLQEQPEQQPEHQQQRSGSEEVRSVGPSC